jgi:hypothetical protein
MIDSSWFIAFVNVSRIKIVIYLLLFPGNQRDVDRRFQVIFLTTKKR